MKKKLLRILVPILIILIVVGGGCIWYFQIKKPHDKAVKAFNSAITEFNAASSDINEKNKELDSAISPAQELLNSGESPYDEQTLSNAKDAISKAQDSKRSVPTISKDVKGKNTKEIKSYTKNVQTKTEQLKQPLDYSNQITVLQESQKALKDSIQQLKQITNPSEDFILQRLQATENISGIQAVTEDNDPNGNLHKPGGYTSAVYFTSTLINQDDIYGKDIIEKGTDAGGSIEVYENKEDATKRNEYLASFDGATMLNSGSHNIIGTIVVRTSSKLSASQQSELEQLIIDKFIELQ